MNMRAPSGITCWVLICAGAIASACTRSKQYEGDDNGANGAAGDPGVATAAATGAGGSANGDGNSTAGATSNTTMAVTSSGVAGSGGTSSGGTSSDTSGGDSGAGGDPGTGGDGGSHGIGGLSSAIAGSGGSEVTSSDGSTTTGGSGGGTSGPQLGAACDEQGALGCNGAAQKLKLICEDGVWKNNGTCDTNENCDQTSGVCAPIDEACDGLSAGYRYCADKTVRECRVDQVNSKDVEECSAACLVVEGQARCVHVQQVAAGPHSCALLDTGQVRCWGNNANGQLGYGHTNVLGDEPFEMPTADVQLGQAARYVAVGQVYTASSHTCAVLADGAVRCWGQNNVGQLGLGHKNSVGDDELPTKNVPLDEPALAVAAGGHHSCALLESGAVRCWGSGSQLGIGASEGVGDNAGEVPTENVPLGAPAIQIAAGTGHTCALLESGVVRCWGSYSQGELGIPDADAIAPEMLPTIDVDLGLPARYIAAGQEVSCAVVGESGGPGFVRCWGDGLFGKLGRGDDNDIGRDEADMPPLGVALGNAFDATHVVISAYHGCALSVSGSVKCWGYGPMAGLASTDTFGDEGSELPQDNIELSGPATALSAGGAAATCAILGDGTLQCWGYNAQGALGLGHSELIGDDETPADAGLSLVF